MIQTTLSAFVKLISVVTATVVSVFKLIWFIAPFHVEEKQSSEYYKHY